MPYYGSVNVFYKKNQQNVNGANDGAAFNALVLDMAVEDHLTDFLEGQYPNEYDTGDMQYEPQEGGDTIYEIKYIGAGDAPEHIQIAPLVKEIGNDTWEVSFSEIDFGEFVPNSNNENMNNNQGGGRRRRRARKTHRRRATHHKRKVVRKMTRRNHRKSRKSRR
jgi:hypothetical protein